MPVHWGKFSTAMHRWNEPIERLILASEELKQRVVAPPIGDIHVIGDHHDAPRWWSGNA